MECYVCFFWFIATNEESKSRVSELVTSLTYLSPVPMERTPFTLLGILRNPLGKYPPQEHLYSTSLYRSATRRWGVDVYDDYYVDMQVARIQTVEFEL